MVLCEAGPPAEVTSCNWAQERDEQALGGSIRERPGTQGRQTRSPDSTHTGGNTEGLALPEGQMGRGLDSASVLQSSCGGDREFRGTATGWHLTNGTTQTPSQAESAH